MTLLIMIVTETVISGFASGITNWGVCVCGVCSCSGQKSLQEQDCLLPSEMIAKKPSLAAGKKQGEGISVEEKWLESRHCS